MFDKKKICFICAAIKGDYCFDGIRQLGYRIMLPYRDHNLIMRCLREAWFRLKLPAKHIWYNPACKRAEAELFIVRDSLMSPEYLAWMRKHHPDARIILDYDNLARTTLDPDSVTDPSIEKWTYDVGDAEKYGMKMKGGGYYDGWHCKKTIPPAHDIVYVGRDKGRAEQMFEMEDQFKALGLKTYFHICADRRFLRWMKPYYKKLLPYAEYLDLIGNTRSILNIVQEGAVSITMREVEALYHSVKCITNNPLVKQMRHYHPSRYFVLGEDAIETLPEFLNTPFLEVDRADLAESGFDHGVKDMYDRKPEV